MFELDYSDIKKKNKLSMIFVIVGSIIAISFLSYFMYGYVKVSFLSTEVDAEYIDPNISINSEGYLVYSPIYHYYVNNQLYKCKTNVSSFKSPKLDGVVYYNPDNPSDCMTDYIPKTNFYLLIGVIIGFIIALIGLVMIYGNTKKLHKLKYLAHKGKLFKGIPYVMEETGIFSRGKNVLRITVSYKTQDGRTVKLVGEPRYDRKCRDEDGLVDLLINPNDISNYYLDFEIKYNGNVDIAKNHPVINTSNIKK